MSIGEEEDAILAVAKILCKLRCVDGEAPNGRIFVRTRREWLILTPVALLWIQFQRRNFYAYKSSKPSNGEIGDLETVGEGDVVIGSSNDFKNQQ